MPYTPAVSINSYGLGNYTGVSAANAMLPPQQSYNDAWGQEAYTGALLGTSYMQTYGTVANAQIPNYFVGVDWAFGTTVQQPVYNYQYVPVTNAVYGTQYVVYATPAPMMPMTPEQLEELEKEREAAKVKARELLEGLLDERQAADLKKYEWFEVDVRGRLYRIKPGRKVEKLDPQTKELESLHCIHPEGWELPADDVAVSQKLWLETNESEFLRLANHFAP